MNLIFTTLLNQWPSFVGLIAIGLIFWKMFEKHLDETKSLLGENRKLFEEYRILSEHKVGEIERLQKQFRGVLDENERINKRYEEMKAELSKMLLENRGLRRVIDNIEEMLRATGGDVKVLSTVLRQTQDDVKEMSHKILLLDGPDK